MLEGNGVDATEAWSLLSAMLYSMILFVNFGLQFTTSGERRMRAKRLR